jgi:hypothetical protein
MPAGLAANFHRDSLPPQFGSGRTIPSTLSLDVSSRPANGSEAKLRRGPACVRQRGATLAATNDLSAGSVCKRRDAVTLGRKKGLQPRAKNGPPTASASS